MKDWLEKIDDLIAVAGAVAVCIVLGLEEVLTGDQILAIMTGIMGYAFGSKVAKKG